MKIQVEKLVEVEACNICNEEIDSAQFNEKRIDIVKHLFDTNDFNAHEKCINQVTRDCFKKYFK